MGYGLSLRVLLLGGMLQFTSLDDQTNLNKLELLSLA